MSKTREKASTVETAEVELAEVRSRVAEMRAELTRLSEPPQVGWDGVSPETLQEIGKADSTRAALPHAINAGELRELELQQELARLRDRGGIRRLASCRGATAESRGAEQRSEVRLGRCYRPLAGSRDGGASSRVEIAEHKAATNRSREALTAPLVRSLWQQQTKDGGGPWWKW
jgi:hypothetical protein